METEKTFEAGTIARCNRCDTKFRLPFPKKGQRENSKVWRLQEFATSPECGHMDCHWVFDCDN